LLELVVPGRNDSGISAAEQLLGAVALDEPFALEIAGNHLSPWLAVRASGDTMYRQLKRQLGARYAQVRWREVEHEDEPETDPAFLRPGEQMAAAVLDLSGPEHLPLRIWTDIDLGDDARGQSGDPILAILAAVRQVPPHWRALAQLLLLPAPPDWSAPYAPKLEPRHRSDFEGYDVGLGKVYASVAGIGALGLFFLDARLYAGQEWLWLLGSGAGTVGVGAGALWLMRRFAPDPPADPELVRLKITSPGFRAQLRLAIYAPAGASPAELQSELRQLVGAYGQYNQPIGNRLASRVVKEPVDLRRLEPIGKPKVLNIRELAGLWHLPHGSADVPLLERTTYRRILPRPDQVGSGCLVGVAEHQDVRIPVHLPEHVLGRHMLVAAKTRYGKSTLLIRLAEHLMRSENAYGHSALLVVDPHGDLARALLGIVPPERHGDIVYLDATNESFAFGLNPLDVRLGWARDEVTENVVSIMKRQWESSWGSRMENSLRFALAALYEANQIMCDDDPVRGPRQQHTLLDLMPFLMDQAYREHVLKPVTAPLVMQWWKRLFVNFDRRTQIDSVAPTVTKIGRFGSSNPASAIVGQACSTVDPAKWLRSGSVVIVNLASGVLGPGTTALVGATLLNFMKSVILRQVRLAPEERKRITVIVDEFQTIPGAEYETYMSELGKYGCSVVLSSQSLQKLDTMDAVRGESLRKDVFSNIGGLVSFSVSAEDAAALVPELGSPVTADDLVSLPQWDCYVRFAPAGGALGDGQPVFSMRLERPADPDMALAGDLADVSARLFGRQVEVVRREIAAAVDRVNEGVSKFVQQSLGFGQGVPADLAKDAKAMAAKDGSAKKQRTRGARKARDGQAELLKPDGAADEPAPEVRAEDEEHER
jgi:hypothetical protein